MHFRNHVPLLLLLIASSLPLLLSALPQDLEVFTDFEDINGEGEFFIGEEPNRVTVLGFKVETLEDPSLLHSGSKAITLGPGQEGKIFSQRGMRFLGGHSNIISNGCLKNDFGALSSSRHSRSYLNISSLMRS